MGLGIRMAGNTIQITPTDSMKQLDHTRTPEVGNKKATQQTSHLYSPIIL